MNRNKKSKKKKAKKKVKKRKENSIDVLNYKDVSLEQLSKEKLSIQIIESNLEDKSFSILNLLITRPIESNSLVDFDSYSNGVQEKVSLKSKLKIFFHKSKNFFKDINQKTLNLCDSAKNLTTESYDIIKENLKNAKKDFSDFTYNMHQDKRKSNNTQINQIGSKVAYLIKKNVYEIFKKSEISIKEKNQQKFKDDLEAKSNFEIASPNAKLNSSNGIALALYVYAKRLKTIDYDEIINNLTKFDNSITNFNDDVSTLKDNSRQWASINYDEFLDTYDSINSLLLNDTFQFM